jgi:hypothetical protein
VSRGHRLQRSVGSAKRGVKMGNLDARGYNEEEGESERRGIRRRITVQRE